MKKKKGVHDEIARVAYELYETRDKVHGLSGNDFNDPLAEIQQLSFGTGVELDTWDN